MKRTIAGLLLIVSTGSLARADVVTLKNGDRVTGTLVNVKDGSLQLKSEILGALSIPLAQVSTFAAAKPVAVLIKGEKPVQGTLEIKPDGNWQVTADGKAQTIAASKVDVIMPADEYQSLIVEAPKPWQAWKGGVAAGYSVSRGNQDTDTITTTINAVRERPEAPIFQSHLRTTFGLTTILSQATQDSSRLTSHTLSSVVREDYVFTPDNFVFGLAQIDHVSTQGLYLRQTYGGGFGHSLVKNPKTNFSVLGGLTMVHEKFFDGISDQTAALLVGEVFGKQFNKRVRLDHNLNFYPNLSNTGQYRFDTSTILSVKLRTKLSLNTTLIDLFLSNPPAGNQRNNVSLSLGIGYSF
jgi:putative salt-induced outer membrane protein YdiY